MSFEYLVVQVQSARATFVNGEWVGSIPLEEATKDFAKGLESCPHLWEYLQVVGDQQWDLVTANPLGDPGNPYQLLYFKRTK